jgi:phytoene dehydrogenase-like protein
VTVAEAVVIGAGPNGLAAANVLADEGWDVVVLEAEDEPGGGARSCALMEPGYTNDLCSAFYPLGAASPVFSSFDLHEHGLRWLQAPLVLAHPASDDTCAVLSTDLDETADSLDGFSAGDGDAWRRLYDRWDRLERSLLDSLFTPFPPVRGSIELLRQTGIGQLAELARFMLLPVRRLGVEEFTGAGARRLLAGAALHADLPPEAALSGFFGWLMCGLGQHVGFPVPEGGAGAITSALVRRLESRGGSVCCGERVREVVVRGGRAVAVRTVDGTEWDAPRGVLADVDAPTLYRTLVGVQHLSNRFTRLLDRFAWDNATVKVDWNLDGPIPWRADPARRAGTVHITEGVDGLTVNAGELARGLIPSRPFLIVGQQSMTDPSRQPPGKETAWAYTHVPQHPVGDAAGEIGVRWASDDRERFLERLEARVETLAPGFRHLVRARHASFPSNFEDEDANLHGGALNGGTAQLHQQLIFRPVPGLGRPETPIKGLFLASASAHPGGGVHGGPGANAARAALWAFRRQRVRPGRWIG